MNRSPEEIRGTSRAIRLSPRAMFDRAREKIRSAYEALRFDHEGKPISGVAPVDRLQRGLGESIIFLRGLTFLGEGGKKFENVAEFEQEITNGKAVGLIAANHNAHTDHAALVRSLQQNGHHALSDRLVFPRGISFQRNRSIKIVEHMFPTIDVWPSLEPAVTDEDKKAKAEMNRRAFFTTRRAQDNGRVIVLYPEATRGKPGKVGEPGEMGPADALTETYLRHAPDKEMLILPVSIVGTEVMLPLGAFIPRDYPVTVTFGKPIRRSDLREEYKDIEDEDVKLRQMLEGVMYKIAEGLPESYRGYYANKSTR